jgi:hypothetical protein
MGHGGARPGSGSKKGMKYAPTLAKEAIRERVRQIVSANLDVLVEAQIANSRGIKYLVKRDPATGRFDRIGQDGIGDGTGIEVWEKDPSVQAFTDLMNRAADKPTEAIQQVVSGAIEIAWKASK